MLWAPPEAIKTLVEEPQFASGSEGATRRGPNYHDFIGGQGGVKECILAVTLFLRAP